MKDFLKDDLFLFLPCRMSKAKGVRLHIHVMSCGGCVDACLLDAWNSLRMPWKHVRYAYAILIVTI